MLQDGFEEKLASHKQLIETKMSPVITLVKVLQINDSKAFVTNYSQLLEQRYQTPEAMQQLLALLDISKDVAVARVNMFRALGNSGGLAAVCSHRLCTACRVCNVSLASMHGHLVFLSCTASTASQGSRATFAVRAVAGSVDPLRSLRCQ
jgi:hypothetical protein